MVRLTVPAHAAPAGTKVQIVAGQAPPAMPQSAGFTPLRSFDIKVTNGTLRTGVVSVHYDPRTLAADGSTSDLLVMLVSDHRGGWLALPTTADPAALMTSATWPHFSAGVLGYLKSPATWLVQRVLTYPLGPVKKPDCSQHKKWSGQDKGWAAANPNWNGGRILLHPLDACVARAPALYGDQRVDVTNRYWYGMTLSLSASVRVDTGDAFDASSLSDALITELYSKLFGITLVPGHSYAHARVRDNPAGQQVSINSYADPVSFVINAILTIGEFASLGETAAARAEIKAAEDELYAGVAAGRETLDPAFGNPFAGMDWSSFLRPVLDYLPSTGEKWDHVGVSASRYVDVTGDGVPDELLLAACPTSTSANPAQVVVVDGTSTASSPRVIGVLPGVPNGMTNCYSSMSFTTKGTTVTLTGQSYSPDTPSCCPDIMLTLTYQWRGGRFVQTGRTVKPVR